MICPHENQSEEISFERSFGGSELNGISRMIWKDGQEGRAGASACVWILLWSDLWWEEESPGLSRCHQKSGSQWNNRQVSLC